MSKPEVDLLIKAAWSSESTVDTNITCSTCKACCCRLEVMLITDTGVPEHFIAEDKWGARTMRRLEDGWCAALDRNTMLCSIYDKRPLICSEFAMGSEECRVERNSHLITP